MGLGKGASHGTVMGQGHGGPQHGVQSRQGNASGGLGGDASGGNNNPLNDLSEEQREEINEAVRKPHFLHFVWTSVYSSCVGRYFVLVSHTYCEKQ